MKLGVEDSSYLKDSSKTIIFVVVSYCMHAGGKLAQLLFYITIN